MADEPKPVPPEDKKPPEYDAEMERRARDKAKAAYDKVSPIGKSIPPMPVDKKAKGGSIRGGGIESRGKTKGRMV